jgi:aarF domain-containing kinase
MRSIRIVFLRSLLSSLLIVLHPNVIEDIESDLELMKLVAYVFRKKLKYLNLEGAVDEFASLLMLQLDLRAEADHLVRFNQNFANEQDVIFPQVRASCACSCHSLAES